MGWCELQKQTSRKLLSGLSAALSPLMTIHTDKGEGAEATGMRKPGQRHRRLLITVVARGGRPPGQRKTQGELLRVINGRMRETLSKQARKSAMSLAG